MIRGIDASAERFLHDLSRIEDRQARVQQEIATGLKVRQASDAPDDVMNILQLRADIDHANTIDANLGRVKAEVDTADAALGVAVKLVERARVLATQAASTGATDRASAKTEVEQLRSQLIGLTHTMSEGRYVFSGDVDDQPMARRDWTAVPPTAPATSTRWIEDVNGVGFPVAKTAHELFDAGDTAPADYNVLAAMDQLVSALNSDSAEQVRATIPKIIASLDHLNRQVTFYGRAQNRVDDAIKLTKQAVVARTAELSQAQDADMTEALVTLTMTSVQQQATLGAHARIPTQTLFDYLG